MTMNYRFTIRDAEGSVVSEWDTPGEWSVAIQTFAEIPEGFEVNEGDTITVTVLPYSTFAPEE